MKSSALLAILLLAVACDDPCTGPLGLDTPCKQVSRLTDSAMEPDGSIDGGAMDGGDADGSTSECSAETPCPGADEPRCQDGQCIACVESDDCTRFGATPVCNGKGECVQCTELEQDACAMQFKVCLPGANECVECNENADCKDPSKSKCDTTMHQCVPCGFPGECAHIEIDGHTDIDLCDNGTCIECTREDADACFRSGTQYVCNASTHLCDLQRPLHSKTLCNACVDTNSEDCKARPDCVSDDECLEGQVCVNVPAGGGVAVCLQVKDPIAACPRPYFGVTEDPLPTADGEDAKVCTFRNTTTCQAHADYSNKRCGTPVPGEPDQDQLNSGDDSKCGTEGMNDGYCRFVAGFAQYLCTVPCNNNVLDCPGGASSCDNADTPDLCSL